MKKILMATESAWDAPYVVEILDGETNPQLAAAYKVAEAQGRTLDYVKANYTPYDLDEVKTLMQTHRTNTQV